ncbi:MAG: cysteine desulfurase / selenocysteine lyase [Frankiaceae bacterium]|nr:cysteine desulfurase / selenocysteine lyase [Frankiaceae bacterium]
MGQGTLDVGRLRKDFPILEREINGNPLVYLDSAATSQKPRAVLDALRDYYEHHNANVHRGIYTIAEEATAAYEGARTAVAGFIGAADRREVVFTKNSTEAINLVARSLGDAPAGSRLHIGAGDEILITEMEHHSNIVPWQLLAQRSGATLRAVGLTDDGRLDLDSLEAQLTERTKIVAVVHQSNILGTVNPVADIVGKAHAVGALVLVDGSQSVPHMTVDVQAIGADFFVFTGHKMLGPTGIGCLHARLVLLEELPPFLGGGEMIADVTIARSTYAEVPHKFEAGTPMIAEAPALTAAIDYLTAVGLDAIHAHEQALTAYALQRLYAIAGLRIIGPTGTVDRGGAVSFALADIHPHDVGQVLDERGICVRVGHHCAKPVCMRYGVPATTRASFYLYNTTDEIDALVAGLEHVKRFFRAA